MYNLLLLCLVAPLPFIFWRLCRDTKRLGKLGSAAAPKHVSDLGFYDAVGFNSARTLDL